MTLKGHYAFCYANCAAFEARHINLKKIGSSAAKCSPLTLLSGGIKFMRISCEFRGKEASNHSGFRLC